MLHYWWFGCRCEIMNCHWILMRFSVDALFALISDFRHSSNTFIEFHCFVATFKRHFSLSLKFLFRCWKCINFIAGHFFQVGWKARDIVIVSRRYLGAWDCKIKQTSRGTYRNTCLWDALKIASECDDSRQNMYFGSLIIVISHRISLATIILLYWDS